MESHPATEQIISSVVADKQMNDQETEQAYLEAEVSAGVFFADEVMDTNKKLGQIQDIFKNNLATVVSSIYSTKSDIEVVWQSPEMYVIVDRENLLKEGLDSQIEISDTILEVHSRTANKNLNPYPGIKIEQGQPWVILKPEDWDQAEWTIDSFFTNLILAGLSPTKALDYWMVEVREKHLPYWADVRKKSTQAVRGNVNRAKDLIEQHADGEEYNPVEYFRSTYHGKRLNDTTTRVTVNGGYLSPRRDIACHSRNGKYSWGYRGAAPTQLAFAVLRDTLDTNEISHNMVTSFRDYLNTELNDTDEWQYTEEEVIEWVQEFEPN